MRKYLVKDSFLLPDAYARLDAEWPTVMGPAVRSHFDIYCSDDAYNLMSDTWKAFYNNVHTWEFWEPLVRQLDAPVPAPFRSEIREPRSGVPGGASEAFTYARCDVGLGLAGYGVDNGGRGVHIDNPQRIISGLLYFTDQAELDGGEFDVCESNGEIVERVPLAKNRAVISLQNNDGWHKVNPLMRGERRAVYFALSSSVRVWDR